MRASRPRGWWLLLVASVAAANPLDGTADHMGLAVVRVADGNVRRLPVRGAFKKLGAM